jgi:S1-C subfamily serine protease
LASSVWAQNEVDFSRLDAQARKQVKAACYFHKLQGATIYAKCLKQQIAKLDPSATRVGSRATTQQSALPNPRWNESGLATSTSWGGRPTASSIFKAVERSVYLVLAASASEDLKAGRNVSQGSAVAISKTIALTNCHVLKDKPVIVLVTADGFLPAKRQATDVEKDSCVLQVAGGLRPIPALRRSRRGRLEVVCLMPPATWLASPPFLWRVHRISTLRSRWKSSGNRPIRDLMV